MNLNLFVDGSWLFRVAPSLAAKTEDESVPFAIDFNKLSGVVLQHVQISRPICDAIGDRYIAISIFNLPKEIDRWPQAESAITVEMIEKMKRGVHAREKFIKAAVDAGFKETAVFRPLARPYMLKKIVQNQFQEKQVDTTAVALLVRYAITNPYDFHAVITGDADVLPAIRVAYPQYTRNVCVATTHPDELRAEHRQSSFSINNFNFEIPPLYLQDHGPGNRNNGRENSPQGEPMGLGLIITCAFIRAALRGVHDAARESARIDRLNQRLIQLGKVHVIMATDLLEPLLKVINDIAPKDGQRLKVLVDELAQSVQWIGEHLNETNEHHFNRYAKAIKRTAILAVTEYRGHL